VEGREERDILGPNQQFGGVEKMSREERDILGPISHGVYSVIDLVKSNADRGIRGFRGFRGLSESGGLLVVFLPCLVEASLGGLSLDEV